MSMRRLDDDFGLSAPRSSRTRASPPPVFMMSSILEGLIECRHAIVSMAFSSRDPSCCKPPVTFPRFLTLCISRRYLDPPPTQHGLSRCYITNLRFRIDHGAPNFGRCHFCWYVGNRE